MLLGAALAGFSLGLQAAGLSADPLWLSRAGRVRLIAPEEGALESPDLPRPMRSGDRIVTGRASSARLAAGPFELLLGPSAALSAEGEAGDLALRLELGSLTVRPGVEAAAQLRLRLADAELDGAGAWVASVARGEARIELLSGEARLRRGRERVDLVAGQRALLKPGAAIKVESGPAAAAQAASGAGIGALIAGLERERGNSALKTRLAESVRGLAESERRRDAESRAPLSQEERRSILRRTYRTLAEGIDDEAVREEFLLGWSAFEESRLLTAALRLRLCQRLAPADAWLGEALEEYLSRQLPEAARGRAAGRLGPEYAALYRALDGQDWEAAARQAQTFLDAARSLGDAASADRADAAAAVVILRDVARLPADAALSQARFGELLRESESDPAGPVARLEAVLLRFSARSAEPWWQKGAESLRRALVNRALARLGAQASRRYESGDYKAAMAFIVELLQRSPGHPEALGLLEKMQQKKVVVAAAPRRAGASAPERREKPVSAADIAAADAHYRAGKSFFLQDKFKDAQREWEAALKSFPGHGPSRDSLEYLRKDIGGGP